MEGKEVSSETSLATSSTIASSLIVLVCIGWKLFGTPTTIQSNLILGSLSHTSWTHLIGNSLLLVMLSTHCRVRWWVLVTTFVTGQLIASGIWVCLDLPPAMGISAGVMSVLGLFSTFSVKNAYLSGAVLVITLAVNPESTIAHLAGFTVGLTFGLVKRITFHRFSGLSESNLRD